MPAQPDAPPDADLHAALVAIADLLLERVAAATADMQTRDGLLDDAERAAARRLLDDLSLVARAWQAMGGVAAQRLEAAGAALADARQTLDRALGSAPAALTSSD